MAAIDTYLQQILDAVYGEEVRGAIHDAIQQVYDDGRSGVPTSRKINGHDLTTDVTLTSSDVSALANDRTITINGVSKNLSSNPSFTVEAEAGVPATRTINGHALSDDVTLTASDVGAASLTGDNTMTGTLTWSNITHGLKWTTEDGTQFFMRPYSPGNILQVTYIPVGETDQRPAITLNNNGVTSLGKPLRVEDGGTNATTAATALSNLGGVPTTRTVNSKALSSNISLSASDVGAVPTTRKITINGTAKTLDQDVSFTVEGGGGTGSVTSVRVQATSPVVSSVSTAQTASLDTTISLADNYGDTKNPYASKTANYVLAAPNGTAGTPSFRALVANDIPYISASKITTGAMTGPLIISMSSGATGCYVKNTNIDLSSATNGVTSLNQPGFLMQDKNQKNIAYFRGYVESNGNTGYRIGAQQYDTSGNQVTHAVLGVSISKDGTQTWTMPITFQDAVLARTISYPNMSAGANVTLVSANLARFGRVVALNFVVNVTAQLAANATIATISNIGDSTGGPIAYLCAHKTDGTCKTFIKVKDQKNIIANETIPTGYWYVNACIMV